MAKLTSKIENIKIEPAQKEEEKQSKQSYFPTKYKVIYSCLACGNSYEAECYDQVFQDRLLCCRDKNVMKWELVKY